jgi:hypothetical protein
MDASIYPNHFGRKQNRALIDLGVMCVVIALFDWWLQDPITVIVFQVVLSEQLWGNLRPFLVAFMMVGPIAMLCTLAWMVLTCRPVCVPNRVPNRIQILQAEADW